MFSRSRFGLNRVRGRAHGSQRAIDSPKLPRSRSIWLGKRDMRPSVFFFRSRSLLLCFPLRSKHWRQVTFLTPSTQALHFSAPMFTDFCLDRGRREGPWRGRTRCKKRCQVTENRREGGGVSLSPPTLGLHCSFVFSCWFPISPKPLWVICGFVNQTYPVAPCKRRGASDMTFEEAGLILAGK